MQMSECDVLALGDSEPGKQDHQIALLNLRSSVWFGDSVNSVPWWVSVNTHNIGYPQEMLRWYIFVFISANVRIS